MAVVKLSDKFYVNPDFVSFIRGTDKKIDGEDNAKKWSSMVTIVSANSVQLWFFSLSPAKIAAIVNGVDYVPPDDKHKAFPDDTDGQAWQS